MSLDNWKSVYGKELQVATTYKRTGGEIVQFSEPVYFVVHENVLTLLGSESQPLSRSLSGATFTDKHGELMLLEAGFFNKCTTVKKHAESVSAAPLPAPSKESKL